jgi:hypothetical protein
MTVGQSSRMFLEGSDVKVLIHIKWIIDHKCGVYSPGDLPSIDVEHDNQRKCKTYRKHEYISKFHSDDCYVNFYCYNRPPLDGALQGSLKTVM